MPDIPNVPGVPALSSYAADAVVLLFADAIGALLGSNVPQWGIFLDGAPALPAANSTASFGYKQDWTISDYPVEDGGFQSYDKVQLPFDARIRVTSGGSAAARQALLDAVDDIANSLDLYDVVTPEKVYESVNVTHYDYDRTAVNGVGMITIDIWLIEIRVTSTSTFTNTQQPPNAGQQGVGNVQPTDAPASFADRFNAGGGAT